jgi:hypothetical protein
VHAANGENLIYPNYSAQVSHLELDLTVFDLQVNYHNKLPDDAYNYLQSIQSGSASPNLIICDLFTRERLMNLPLNRRKDVLKDLCNTVFEKYQKRFIMEDLDHVNRPSEVGIPGFPMKPCNLEIRIWGRGGWLGTWKCGTLSYMDAFLKD